MACGVLHSYESVPAMEQYQQLSAEFAARAQRPSDTPPPTTSR